MERKRGRNDLINSSDSFSNHATTPRALPSITPAPLPQAPAQADHIDGTAAWLSRRIDQINQENRALRRAALRKC
jgi:hypothetical protein